MAEKSEPSNRDFRETPLYKFLFGAFPEHRTRQDLLDVPRLAEAIELNKESVYKWLRSGRVSVAGAMKLIELSAGKITKEQMFPFVMN